MSAPLTDAESLHARLQRVGRPLALGVDTEFLRERTYFAQLCLLQLSTADDAFCVDTLALQALQPVAALTADASVCKVLHAARQDLEVLTPVTGPLRNVFDTQIAAALLGFPAQVGYGDLVSQLLNVQLHKAHTRTDWSQRPLSPEQLEYALDDVRYLLPLRELLSERLQRRQRWQWFVEESRQFEVLDGFSVDPERAWLRLRGLAALDEPRRRLAQALGAWRERRAIDSNRPRGWLLPDPALRDIVLRVPRTAKDLAAIGELPEGIRNNSGAQLLQLVAAAEVPEPPAPLPQRRRPDPDRQDAVARMQDVVRGCARELELVPEILATRGELEQIVAGSRELGPLLGWRRAVVGEQLLAAL